MSLPKSAFFAAALVVCALFTGCGSGGSTAINTLSSAVQDLTLDPEGTTTVLAFGSGAGLAGATVANFESDGGQTATNVSIVGSSATIVWNARVSPLARVRTSGLVHVSTAYVAVTTSDSSAPTFVVTDGQQVAGASGDIVHVTFTGTHVVKTQAESAANWTLTVAGVHPPFTGSTFSLDTSTQVLTITLGALANLHASFTLAASGLHSVADVAVPAHTANGTATGDAVAPTLVSADQNLTQDEFGRVVDFTFSEAMDPATSTLLSSFSATNPDIAVLVEQPTPDVLRATFNNPIVPGHDTINVTGLIDRHGNAFAGGVQAITQPAPIVNAYDGTPVATTVADSGGDTLTVVTTQAFDPDSAVDPTAWTLDVAGVTVDLTAQTLTYDLTSKTLTIAFNFDMVNGDAFTITGVSVLDVDGQTFTATASGTAAGDATPPTIVSSTQNRNVDTAGKTVDVKFSEDLDIVSAQNPANWHASGTQSVVSATLLAGLETVRVVFDTFVVPGDITLNVQNVADLAGNPMVTVPAATIVSTDTTAPNATSAIVQAIEGADNDNVVVDFDDDMIPAEVQDVTHWNFESPIGTTVSLATSTAVYNTSTRSVRLTLHGWDLQRGDDYKVSFANCRDIAANPVSSQSVTGLVDAETTLPTVVGVHRVTASPGDLVVVFSEPCKLLTDLYDASTNPDGTRYALRTSGGLLRGYATSAVSLDTGLAVDVSFGVVIDPTDTLDVLGITDLTGNPMFPSLAHATVAESTGTPTLDFGNSTLVSVAGENNDVVTVLFGRPMSPWNILTSTNYTIVSTGGAVDLSFADFSFDGNRTVTIGLKNASYNNLLTGIGYDLSITGVRSAQDTLLGGTSTDPGIVVTGDSTAPTVLSTDVRLDPSDVNSVLLKTSESLDQTSAETASNYDLGGGLLATSAQRISPRVVRATFSSPPSPGDTITFTVTDLAGNTSASISRTVTAADTTPPLVANVSGTIKKGYGGDTVTVTFDEPVLANALVGSHYAVTSNGSPVSLTGARFSYLGNTHSVLIRLPAGSDLDASGGITVSVSGVSDVSGNFMPSMITTGGSVSGDNTPPTLQNAFVNWRTDPTGQTIDVLFSEDVDAAIPSLAASWNPSGGQSVQTATMMERSHYRLVLSAPLGSTDTLGIIGVRDTAHNLSGLLTIDPVE